MDQVNKLNYVNAGLNGTFRPTGAIHSVPTDVDAIAAAIAVSKRPVVVHFHGGLVDEQQGMATAAALTPVYELAGCHPITVVWETGFIETVTRNIGSLYKTDLFQEILRIVLERVAKHIGLEGARGPGLGLSAAEIETELQKPVPFENVDTKAAAGARGGPAPGMPQLDEIEEELREDLEANTRVAELLERPEQVAPMEPQYRGPIEQAPKGARGVPLWLLKPLAKITWRSAVRWWDGRDHGFYPTVMEEILRELYLASAGNWIWGGMKKAAAGMFVSNNGLNGTDLHAGLYLVNKLASAGVPINLVGHSAGSIAICELFRAAARDNLALNIRDVLFLAPASTSDMFWREIGSHPERYQRFRMFTMLDENESKDVLVPYVYTRSLLYLISGILEDEADTEIAGMQRYLSGGKPYDSSLLLSNRGFFNAQDRLVLAKTADAAAEGLRCGALKHGLFDDDDLTRKSLQFLLRP